MGIFHVDIVQASTDIVALLQVRLDLQTAMGADRQRSVRETHLIEVGLGEIAADGTFYLVWIEQEVCSKTAFEDVVVACDAGLSATVSHVDGGCQVVKVPLTVLEGEDLGIGRHTTSGGQQVCAIA